MRWLALNAATVATYSAFALLDVPSRFDVPAMVVLITGFVLAEDRLQASRATGDVEDRGEPLLRGVVVALVLLVVGLLVADTVARRLGEVTALGGLLYLVVGLPLGALLSRSTR